MNVSPDALRKETVSLLSQIETQIEQVKAEAIKKGISYECFRDEFGNWPMIPLLAAKVVAISTLAQLNQPRPMGTRRKEN